MSPAKKKKDIINAVLEGAVLYMEEVNVECCGIIRIKTSFPVEEEEKRTKNTPYYTAP